MADMTLMSTMLPIGLILLFIITPTPVEGIDPNPDAAAMARLEWMPGNQPGMLNVNAVEGRYLFDHVVEAKARRALEIGTSNGYSSIWIALGCRKTGGHLTTVEIDHRKIELAKENFRAAQVEPLITMVEGDALREIPKHQGPFEFVFIDAWKNDYVKYIEMVLPMVPRGGIIMAHNTLNQRTELQGFIDRVRNDPRLKTVLVEPGPGGFSVSVKVKN
jgi:caffeoyl-CoA O-methyltransferase